MMPIKIDGSAFRAGGRPRSAVGEDAMKLRISGFLVIAAFVAACLLGSAQSPAQNAYITNFGEPDHTVSVIDTETNTVIATIPVGDSPFGVAVSPDGSKVYVTNLGSASVSVIATATDTVTATIPVAGHTDEVAVSSDGSKVYVTNVSSGNVSVIDPATNTVTATIPVGLAPLGVAVTPDGSKVYVANVDSHNVSVIETATNTVIATIPVGTEPVAFGIFIQPAPRFAGTPGHSNCHGQSVAALARQFGGLNAAATALAFSSVKALQNAILAFCGG
jgi:YVTN family beta-propeller protein